LSIVIRVIVLSSLIIRIEKDISRASSPTIETLVVTFLTQNKMGDCDNSVILLDHVFTYD
jgi:hypothetical protein